MRQATILHNYVIIYSCLVHSASHHCATCVRPDSQYVALVMRHDVMRDRVDHCANF